MVEVDVIRGKGVCVDDPGASGKDLFSLVIQWTDGREIGGFFLQSRYCYLACEGGRMGGKKEGGWEGRRREDGREGEKKSEREERKEDGRRRGRERERLQTLVFTNQMQSIPTSSTMFTPWASKP